ncbi:MAG: N-acyl-D-amino-acid deacylase, partial [Candidatus Promineifilaceae bacterium]
MFDTIIKNGTIIDGKKTQRYSADVGIIGDKVAAIGQLDLADSSSAVVIDAAGKIVSPGFIDVHTHTDGWYLKKPNFFSKTGQGFTSEVIMADGISYAPVNKHTAYEWIYYLRGLNGLQFEDYTGWESIADYMALLDRKTAQNTIPHIPYANVRTLACGFGRQGPDDVQMNQILGEIEKGMDAGAVGLSSGLDYIVECWATTDELVEACTAMAPQQGLYVTHIRYRKGMIPALKEAIEIGKRAGVPVHISHLKGGSSSPNLDDSVINFINDVAVNEVDFSFDVYPYMASSTMLNYLFPYEVWQDGPQQVYKHLRRPEMQSRAKAALAHIDLRNATIAWLPSKANSQFQGKTLQHYVETVGDLPIKALTNLLIEENLAVLLVFRVGDDRLIEPFLQHPNYMMGSDGIYQEDGLVHPRHYGSAAKLIGPMVRDKKLFSLEEAVSKMTSIPAKRFGLTRRGVLAEGNFADLVVFDADAVSDRATMADPIQLSVGIEHVLVNGVPIVANGRPLNENDPVQPGRA